MFKVNDICYVKTSSGYIQCKIIRKQGSYYIVRTNTSSFGASEHRLMTVEEYQKQHVSRQKPTYYRPPDLH